MATNLYGPGDNFNLASSHVLPALMRKFHEARLRGDDSVTVWGSGRPRREFLYSEDMADACVFVLEAPEDQLNRVAPDSMLNVGCGKDLSIRELCVLLQEVIGTNCTLDFDRSKPDGTPRKLVDVSRLTAVGLAGSNIVASGCTRDLYLVSGTLLMKEKTALITGVTGQDGAYLSELLLSKGYIVHGVKRRASLFNTQRVDHLYTDPHVGEARFRLHYGDLTDSTNLIRIVQEVQPDEIYNLGSTKPCASKL